MPNFRCKKCGSINQVLPDNIHFTCKACGEVQDTPALSEQVESVLLDDMLLGQEKKQDFGASAVNDTVRKDGIYFTALSKIGGEDVRRYREAIEMLQSIRGWRDTDALIKQCEETILTLEKEKSNRRQEVEKRIKWRKVRFFTLIPAAMILIAAIILSIFVFVPDANYKKALAAAQSGDVVAAYEMFDSLKEYKDSRERTAALFEKYKTEKIKVAAVGDTVYFGTYEQNANKADGKEDIAWKVLDKDGDTLLLLSVYGLDSVPYHTELVPTTWESSSFRKWLNTAFFNTAFSAAEQEKIITAAVKADKNPDFDTNPGKDTQDKMFVLSLSQVEKYLPEEKGRICHSTAYAETKGIEHNTNGTEASWFIRTPGMDQTMICYTQREGVIRRVGSEVNTPGSVIRPAIWVNVHS